MRAPDWQTADGAVRLYLGDCLELLPQMESGSVDAVVTDPPYGILNLEGQGSTPCVRKSPRQQGSGTLKDRLLNQSNADWDAQPPSRETLDRLRSLSRWQVVWGGNYFDLPPCRAVLVWDKEQPWENFSQVELAWSNLMCPAGLFRESVCRGIPNRQHPTQKPLSLMLWCLERIGDDAKVVLDPYAGSGTTGVACIRTGRRFIGIEKEPKYFEIAVKRIEAELKRTALFELPPQIIRQNSLFGESEAAR